MEFQNRGKHPSFAIGFDLDGTLWDTTAIVARAWNIAIEQNGHSGPNYRPSDITGLMGLTGEEIRKRFFSQIQETTGRELLDKCFVEESRQLRQPGCAKKTLYNGVREGIAQLASRYHLFVVSNCDQVYLDSFLEVSGLRQYFTGWECHGRTGLTKGENLKQLLARHGFNGNHAGMYLGDTEGDLQAARYAGLNFGYASYGFGLCSEYDYRFDTFNDVIEKFTKGLPKGVTR